MALSHVNGLAAGSASELGFLRAGGRCCELGLPTVPLLPDLQDDLAAGAPARVSVSGVVFTKCPKSCARDMGV
jgi:hypothetical protein